MAAQNLTRREMITIMEKYTEAVIQKKPELLPLAENVRATFNGVECAVGDNPMWKNTLVMPERQTFIDTVTGEMVLFGTTNNETVERNFDFPIEEYVYNIRCHFTARIKLEDGLITQIEELAADRRQRNFYGDVEDIHLPDLIFEIPIPEEERSTREELHDIVTAYWNCIAKKGGDPADPANLPIHPDAQRFENGYRTTNHSHSVRGDFTHNKGFYWETPEAERKFPVIDPVRGVVVSYAFLAGQGYVEGGYRGAYIVEAFKIKDGAISRLYAHFPALKGTTSGWEGYDYAR